MHVTRTRAAAPTGGTAARIQLAANSFQSTECIFFQVHPETQHHYFTTCYEIIKLTQQERRRAKTCRTAQAVLDFTHRTH